MFYYNSSARKNFICSSMKPDLSQPYIVEGGVKEGRRKKKEIIQKQSKGKECFFMVRPVVCV